jgi:glycine cleavage system T protein
MSELVHSQLDGYGPQAGPLVEYHGALLPAWYSDSFAEHRAVRETAGVFDYSFRAKFTARGSDRVRFLQGMVSNDVKILASGHGTYALLLDVRGHILADLRIYCAEDRFIIDTDADLLEKSLQALNHYNIGGRTPLEPLKTATLAVQGPKARAILTKTLGLTLPQLDALSHLSVDCAGRPTRIVRASDTGEDGYELWIESEWLKALWDTLLERGRTEGLLPCGVNALETLRIEAGVPKYGSELAEDTLPLEAGLLNAISFNKGCYLGQEIVERARSRGRVNWKLVGLTIESNEVPAKGDRLLADGKDIGEITSASSSPSLGRVIGMGYVRREHSEPGMKLTLGSGGIAEVTVLPFYRGAREGVGSRQ